MSQQPSLVSRQDHPPRWALVLLSLGLLVAVGLLFRWLEQKDPERRVAGTPASFSRPKPELPTPPGEQATERPQEPPQATWQGPVTALNQLLQVPAEEALAGRHVALDDVPVLEVVGDYTFWVGTDAQARVPVVLLGELTQRQPERQVQVRPGQRLRIFGIVRSIRDAEALREADVWLSPKELEALRQERFFISAQRVVPLEQ